MPGTKNRVNQPPANARVRAEAHRERETRNHRKPSPERQARLHPSRAEQVAWKVTTTVVRVLDKEIAIDVDEVQAALDAIQPLDPYDAHPRPWRAPDKKTGGKGWHVLDANDEVAEYTKSRDKARARVKEVNAA